METPCYIFYFEDNWPCHKTLSCYMAYFVGYLFIRWRSHCSVSVPSFGNCVTLHVIFNEFSLLIYIYGERKRERDRDILLKRKLPCREKLVLIIYSNINYPVVETLRFPTE